MNRIEFQQWLLKYLPQKYAQKYINRILRKEGQGVSIVAREYYKRNYCVDVGLYSYGGCFNSDFNVGGTVSLGRYCSIANNVHYFGANHPISHVSTSAYFYNRIFGLKVKDVKREKLEIGHDVWIGYGTIILSGCHKIGNGAVIGAGSIVTHDIPPYAVAVGNPAKVIKYRFSKEDQQQLEESGWWMLEPKELIKFYDSFNNVTDFVRQI